MSFFKNKTTVALVLIMSAIVLVALAVASFYYKKQNNSVDPRIVEARTLYEKYNVYTQSNSFNSVLMLMDSIEMIYNKTSHYQNSYEMGVLYNNRAASFITQALFSEGIEQEVQDSLLLNAERAAKKSIEIYDLWLDIYQDKNALDLEEFIALDFFIGLENYSDKQKNIFLQSRIDEIQEAQIETKRRQSVSYNNLGIIYRHRLQYETAAHYYKQAIDLWDRNLTAENNLNILLGRPLVKRNFIQKMFPPSREKD